MPHDVVRQGISPCRVFMQATRAGQTQDRQEHLWLAFSANPLALPPSSKAKYECESPQLSLHTAAVYLT